MCRASVILVTSLYSGCRLLTEPETNQSISKKYDAKLHRQRLVAYNVQKEKHSIMTAGAVNDVDKHPIFVNDQLICDVPIFL